MYCKLRTYLLCFLFLCTVGTQAHELSSEARISLLTCAPGEELYTRFGHTAIRVYDPEKDIDVTFNYGIFNFNTEHFYWKFVRGETWYELGVTPTWWFMREYEESHRPVYEQVINFQHYERDSIWNALITNYLPQNRQYLYNFVYDNCATRPYQLLTRTYGDSIYSSYTGYTGQSYRTFIRHYVGAHSWANAGINLLFGPKADKPMSDQERLFLPEELMFYIDKGYLCDATPVTFSDRIAPFVIASTPWYASWELGLVLYVLLVIAISYYDRRRGKWSKWLEISVAIPYGLLILLVTFLTFFSCHPLVGFGWRLLIIPLTHLCARIIYIYR